MEQLLEFAANHAVLFAAFGTVVTLLIANEVHGNVAGAPRLAPAEVVRLINDQQALVLDVRAPADYKKGHILDARNLPVNKLEERQKELGKDKARPIVVYCALGSSASSVTDKLVKLGYEKVFILKGGINGWQGAGMPVTTKA